MLEVIGAGFGRTGTLSLEMALERLGYDRCYHMSEVLDHPEHAQTWRAAADGRPTDWEALFRGYPAAVDWPACYFWRELADRYPQAKVILTEREPHAWYRSARQTIYRAMTEHAKPGAPSMSADLILERTFGGRFLDEDHACEVFRSHNAAVRAALPAERLLVYEVGSGWGPLCGFLGRPVPETRFPHTNTTADFGRRFMPAGDTEQA